MEMPAERRVGIDGPTVLGCPIRPTPFPGKCSLAAGFSGWHVPRWVLRGDVSDALTLDNWLW